MRIARPKILGLMAIVLVAVVVAVPLKILLPNDAARRPLTTGDGFAEEDLGTTYHLFDLGVARIDDDALLDIFTVNHSFRQSILINDRRDGYTDKIVALGLGQNPDFPGLGPSASEPLLDGPGLYLYWHKSALVAKAHGLDPAEPVSGRIDLPRTVVVAGEGAMAFTSVERDRRLIVDFKATGNGALRIESKRFYFHPLITLDPGIALERVFVGTERRHPAGHDFSLLPGRDRHGMAWADLNGDARSDVFIARGGGSGRMKADPVTRNDELLLKQGQTFTDAASRAGIVKGVCPGRKVALVDFDGDGRLDIHTGCGRHNPPRQRHPDQLHRQHATGQFRNVSSYRGLAVPEQGQFVWLDVEADGDMDLVFADQTAFWLYRNHRGDFAAEEIGRHQGYISQLTLADFDRDGDPDVFAASNLGNALLVNREGGFEVAAPEALGLPARSETASWVDSDNDGLVDLHSFPDGLFRQRTDGGFSRTGQLARRSDRLYGAFLTWFDADNDGDRDLLLAVEVPPTSMQRVQRKVMQLLGRAAADELFTLSEWRLKLYRNPGGGHHWLQVRLQGPTGNLPAIGAKVEVETADGVQRQQLGEAEGSHRSQGHYRMYFGLGANDRVTAVRVYWPGGAMQELKNVAADQLLSIAQDPPYGS